MKYFYDTEFIEDGRTIDLISIGIVAEDGRQYYAVNADIDDLVDGGDENLHRRICQHKWLMQHVVPLLPLRSNQGLRRGGDGLPPTFHLDEQSTVIRPKWLIANEVRRFILPPTVVEDPVVEMWADYGAYDHIVLMQLFGTMMDKPPQLPMWTHDLQQLLAQQGIDDPDQFWPRQGTAHNALDDARHVKLVHDKVWDRIAGRPT